MSVFARVVFVTWRRVGADAPTPDVFSIRAQSLLTRPDGTFSAVTDLARTRISSALAAASSTEKIVTGLANG
jgi:hypothetical protein